MKNHLKSLQQKHRLQTIFNEASNNPKNISEDSNKRKATDKKFKI